MATEEFRPDNFGLEPTCRQEFRLVWRRCTGEQQTVVLDKDQLFAVHQELAKHARFQDVSPAELDELLSGEAGQVTGLGFAPAFDCFRLTAFVEVPQQAAGVTVSLRLSKDDTAKCIATMTQWLAQQGETPNGH